MAKRAVDVRWPPLAQHPALLARSECNVYGNSGELQATIASGAESRKRCSLSLWDQRGSLRAVAVYVAARHCPGPQNGGSRPLLLCSQKERPKNLCFPRETNVFASKRVGKNTDGEREAS